LLQQLQEFVEINEPLLILAFIHRRDHSPHLFLARLEAERTEHHFKCSCIDHTLPLCVEEIKGLSDFAALLLAEHQLPASRLRMQELGHSRVSRQKRQSGAIGEEMATISFANGLTLFRA